MLYCISSIQLHHELPTIVLSFHSKKANEINVTNACSTAQFVHITWDRDMLWQDAINEFEWIHNKTPTHTLTETQTRDTETNKNRQGKKWLKRKTKQRERLEEHYTYDWVLLYSVQLVNEARTVLTYNNFAARALCVFLLTSLLVLSQTHTHIRYPSHSILCITVIPFHTHAHKQILTNILSVSPTAILYANFFLCVAKFVFSSNLWIRIDSRTKNS